MNQSTTSFEAWALIELFGHNKLAGRCSEQNVAGSNMLRVDVPETKSNPSFTRLLNHAAIYAINPVTEDVARMMAERIEAKPIESWDIQKYQQKLQAKLLEGQVNSATDHQEEEEEENDGRHDY